MNSKHHVLFPLDQFPELESERLIFSAISRTDADRLLELRSNDKVMRYIKRSVATDLKGIYTFIEYIQKGFEDHEFIFWTIRQKDDPRIIGTISLWHFTDDKTEAEMGYELHPDKWGHGFADESVKRILEFGFEVLQLQKIEAFTHQSNESSKNLLAKNNFVLQPKRVDEGNKDNRIYILER